MHKFQTVSRVLAAAVSAGFVCYTAPSSAFTVTVNGTAATSCSAPSIDAFGNITINCSSSATACSVSASPQSVPSGGGSVTLTSNCGAVTSWAGGKSASGGQSTSWMDTIPANTSASSQTYRYTVVGVNGTSFVDVTQAAAGSAPPPPPTGNIKCEGIIGGISSTTSASVSWNYTAGLTSTRSLGGFGPGKAMVFQFTTPSVSSSNKGYFSMVPTDANAYNNRYMSLSDTPCDLSGKLASSSIKVGSAPSIYFTVGAYAQSTSRLGGNDLSVAKLNPGQTYYVTIIQEATPGGENTCGSSACDINYSLSKPAGT